MKTFSVWYRYNGHTNELRLEAEDFEQARERVIVFKASKDDEPRIHCLGDATPEQVGAATSVSAGVAAG